MTITPDQARELLSGATPGPWEHQAGYLPGDNRDGNVIMTGNLVLATYDGGYGGNPEWTNSLGNLPLVAAAPDLAQTIAGMRYEYAVEMMDDGEWKDIWDLWSTEKEARKEYASLAHADSIGDYRLVSRLVGPVEVVE